MYFLYFLIFLFILLLLITVFTTLIKLSIKAVTRHTYSDQKLILPSLLSSICWIILFYIMFIFLKKEFNINILDNLFDGILAKTLNNDQIVKIVLNFATFSIIGIFIQAFTFLITNVQYKINKKDVQEQNGKNYTLTYSNALVASLFSFALVFFMTLVFLSIGNFIAKKVV